MLIHQAKPIIQSSPILKSTLQGHTRFVRALVVLPNGMLVSGSSDETIKLWDQSGHCIKTLVGHTDQVLALAVLPNGNLASGSLDKTIKVWDKMGKCIKTLEGHDGAVWALAVLSDGMLVSGSADKTVKLWDQAGQCIKTFEGHANAIRALAVLPNGTIASGSNDKTIKLWDRSGNCIQSLQGHKETIYALAALPDGALVSGSEDKTIRLWDQTGQCIQVLKGHTNWINALAVLSDHIIVSGAWDKTIKLWDRSGRCLQTLEGHTEPVYALTILLDGTLASGSKDSSIKLWDVQALGLGIQAHQKPAVSPLLALEEIKEAPLPSISVHEPGALPSIHIETIRHVVVPPMVAEGPAIPAVSRALPRGVEVKKASLHPLPLPVAPPTVAADPALPAVSRALPGGEVKEDSVHPSVAPPSVRIGTVRHPVAQPSAAVVPSIADAIPVRPIPARPVPPLVSEISELLKDVRAFPLSPREQRELANIEAYHQHFYAMPLTDEARHELMRHRDRLDQLIDHKTQKANQPAPNPIPEGGAAHARPGFHPAAAGITDSRPGVFKLDLSIPFETLQYQQKLGEGNFGVVYRGLWGQHTEVAIKELKQQNLNAESLQAFKQEAAVMAQLQNPRIVRFYGVCLHPAHYSLVMEYLPNVSLQQLLHNQQPLPWSLRHRIVMDITKGMIYLHDRGMVHCDLKSDNVLLDDQLSARIADFGLAKMKNQGKSAQGCIPWMAQELFQQGAQNTMASDVYAYGMLLWEVASRKLPFVDAAGNRDVLINWVREGKKETIPESCPEELKTLIVDCWKTAEQRPRMVDALERLQRWQVPQAKEVPVSDLYASARQIPNLIKLKDQEAMIAADQLYAARR